MKAKSTSISYLFYLYILQPLLQVLYGTKNYWCNVSTMFLVFATIIMKNVCLLYSMFIIDDNCAATIL